MGLKDWYLRHKAGELGKETPLDIKGWLLANKGPIGLGFGVVWGWAAVQGCPVIFGINITQHVECAKIVQVLGMISSYLIGAGYMKSDIYWQDKRDGK